MNAPVRLRLSRAKGFDLQAHSRQVNGLPAVNVARPSRWGNPFKVGDRVFLAIGERALPRRHGMTASEAVEHFRRSLMHDGTVSARIIRELRGKNLACWCAPGAPCHADVLLELANA